MDRFVYFTCPANRRKIRNNVGVIAVPFGDTTFALSDPVVDFFTKTLDYLEMRLIVIILVPESRNSGKFAPRNR